MAKFTISSDGDRDIDCVLFHDAQKAYDEITDNGHGAEPGYGCRADILGTVEINHWRDEDRVQIIAKYVLPAGTLN
jgi:hypothetical protein